MRASVSRQDLQQARIKDHLIRFTPMTELYKPVVELSKSILRHRPASGTDEGQKRVHGVLLDIAEVWEYYVFRLLQESFPEMEVLHTGRDREFNRYLLHSRASNRGLGKLYPDICVRRRGSTTFDYIIDAKYKAALNSGHLKTRPQREDLYQITSYLAALGKRDGSTVGVLAYPIAGEEQAASNWQSDSLWDFPSSGIGQVRFLGISVEHETSLPASLFKGAPYSVGFERGSLPTATRIEPSA
jgi:5-methylcytosine-specific restriction endonuclease McrBC regulatory subunit McrC